MHGSENKKLDPNNMINCQHHRNFSFSSLYITHRIKTFKAVQRTTKNTQKYRKYKKKKKKCTYKVREKGLDLVPMMVLGLEHC